MCHQAVTVLLCILISTFCILKSLVWSRGNIMWCAKCRDCRWTQNVSEVEHPVSVEWQLMTGGPTVALKTLELRMPNCR